MLFLTDLHTPNEGRVTATEVTKLLCAKRKRDSAQPQESTRLSSSSSYGAAYYGRAQCSYRRLNGIALAGASSNRRFHEVFSSHSSFSHNANPAQSTHN